MRAVPLPAGVPGRLYLAAMPGADAPLPEAVAAIQAGRIAEVVCLTGAREIATAAPEYAAALARGVPWRHTAHPIADFGAPADRVAFCALAKRLADDLLAGEAVLVHCRAGIGRSGLLAIAVLLALGEPLADATRAVAAAGGRCESHPQREVLAWLADAPARVAECYDRVADAWQAARAAARPPALLERFAAALPPGARVLDVGCGSGQPVAAALAARGLAVTGLDASSRLLAHARGALPGCAFVHGDVRTADPGGPFEGIVAWDSLFHLPREDHAAVFARLAAWLRPGGPLLLSLGGSAGAFAAEMLGEIFYFAAHAPATALAMLEAAGFTVEHWEVNDPGSRGHVAVLAARRRDCSPASPGIPSL